MRKLAELTKEIEELRQEVKGKVSSSSNEAINVEQADSVSELLNLEENLKADAHFSKKLVIVIISLKVLYNSY